jgi:phosphinothricin acetyltransferase
MNTVTTRAALATDAAAVASIYNHYVRNTIVTFEEEPVTVEEMGARMERVHEAGLPWLLALHDGEACGYAHAARWHTRSAYRFTVESTVYLDHRRLGRGFGRQLYSVLLDELRVLDLHSVIGVIALPNPASVALHERLGFRAAGLLRKAGFKFDRWIDVGYWQQDLAANTD